ncbi:hypothetical protein NMS_2619 [Nonlabens marinus S1-08]|uniref:Uncharacterized protein n=1 Tax=Nonlabens marinus S1-08 TaxID=1454201 RepID=W8VWU2_9FLAO|nr:hypothetical protein NMS_2619 [Nonlabens marinus S1-08]
MSRKGICSNAFKTARFRGSELLPHQATLNNLLRGFET